MKGKLLTGFSESGILFLVETTDPRLVAKKPLNYISDNFLQFKKQKLFPSASAN